MTTIQEHLTAFDGWLTSRLEEAHATRKDLAFRDLAVEERRGGAAWEYSLLEPGARSPQGEGWSVYRLNGVWPDRPAGSDHDSRSLGGSGRRSVLDMIAGAVLGRGPRR